MDMTVSSRVTLFASPSFAASYAAAVEFARAQPDAEDDLRVLAPADGGRWRVEDLETVMFAAALRPTVRNLLVLERADDISDDGMTRLLKTFEEPPAPTWFLLCVRDPDTLPGPVRGRVHRVEYVPSPPADVVAAAMVAGGADPAEAAAVASAVHPRTELAPLIGTKAVAALEELAAATVWPLSAAAAAAAASAVDAVAAAAKPPGGRSSDLERWRTALKRDLAAMALQRWQQAVSSELFAAAAARRQIRHVEAAARRLDSAASLLDRGAPVPAAFAALA